MTHGIAVTGRRAYLFPVTPKLARRALGGIVTACLALTAISVFARPALPPAPHHASLLPAGEDPGPAQGENNIVVETLPGGDQGTIMIHTLPGGDVVTTVTHPLAPKPTLTPRPTHKA